MGREERVERLGLTDLQEDTSCAMKKVDKLRCQVVQLKQLVRRWKAATFRRRAAAVGDIGGAVTAARPVPPGFLAVYVGPERRRFVIPTRFLSFPVFSALLSLAEEEFGFPGNGGLALPCAAEFFQRVLEILDTDEARFKNVDLEGFLELSGRAGLGTLHFSSSRCWEEAQYPPPIQSLMANA